MIPRPCSAPMLMTSAGHTLAVVDDRERREVTLFSRKLVSSRARIDTNPSGLIVMNTFTLNTCVAALQLASLWVKTPVHQCACQESQATCKLVLHQTPPQTWYNLISQQEYQYCTCVNHWQYTHEQLLRNNTHMSVRISVGQAHLWPTLGAITPVKHCNIARGSRRKQWISAQIL